MQCSLHFTPLAFAQLDGLESINISRVCYEFWFLQRQQQHLTEVAWLVQCGDFGIGITPDQRLIVHNNGRYRISSTFTFTFNSWCHFAGNFDLTTPRETISIDSKHIELTDFHLTDKVDRVDWFRIGVSAELNFQLIEFRIWSVELPESVLIAWKSNVLSDRHPLIQHLEAYWRFNSESHVPVEKDCSFHQRDLKLVDFDFDHAWIRSSRLISSDFKALDISTSTKLNPNQEALEVLLRLKPTSPSDPRHSTILMLVLDLRKFPVQDQGRKLQIELIHLIERTPKDSTIGIVSYQKSKGWNLVIRPTTLTPERKEKLANFVEFLVTNCVLEDRSSVEGLEIAIETLDQIESYEASTIVLVSTQVPFTTPCSDLELKIRRLRGTTLYFVPLYCATSDPMGWDKSITLCGYTSGIKWCFEQIFHRLSTEIVKDVVVHLHLRRGNTLKVLNAKSNEIEYGNLSHGDTNRIHCRVFSNEAAVLEISVDSKTNCRRGVVTREWIYIYSDMGKTRLLEVEHLPDQCRYKQELLRIKTRSIEEMSSQQRDRMRRIAEDLDKDKREMYQEVENMAREVQRTDEIEEYIKLQEHILSRQEIHTNQMQKAYETHLDKVKHELQEITLELDELERHQLVQDSTETSSFDDSIVRKTGCHARDEQVHLDTSLQDVMAHKRPDSEVESTLSALFCWIKGKELAVRSHRDHFQARLETERARTQLVLRQVKRTSDEALLKEIAELQMQFVHGRRNAITRRKVDLEYRQELVERYRDREGSNFALNRARLNLREFIITCPSNTSLNSKIVSLCANIPVIRTRNCVHAICRALRYGRQPQEPSKRICEHPLALTLEPSTEFTIVLTCNTFYGSVKCTQQVKERILKSKHVLHIQLEETCASLEVYLRDVQQYCDEPFRSYQAWRNSMEQVTKLLMTPINTTYLDLTKYICDACSSTSYCVSCARPDDMILQLALEIATFTCNSSVTLTRPSSESVATIKSFEERVELAIEIAQTERQKATEALKKQKDKLSLRNFTEFISLAHLRETCQDREVKVSQFHQTNIDELELQASTLRDQRISTAEKRHENALMALEELHSKANACASSLITRKRSDETLFHVCDYGMSCVAEYQIVLETLLEQKTLECDLEVIETQIELEKRHWEEKRRVIQDMLKGIREVEKKRKDNIRTEALEIFELVKAENTPSHCHHGDYDLDRLLVISNDVRDAEQDYYESLEQCWIVEIQYQRSIKHLEKVEEAIETFCQYYSVQNLERHELIGSLGPGIVWNPQEELDIQWKRLEFAIKAAEKKKVLCQNNFEAAKLFMVFSREFAALHRRYWWKTCDLMLEVALKEFNQHDIQEEQVYKERIAIEDQFHHFIREKNVVFNCEFQIQTRKQLQLEFQQLLLERTNDLQQKIQQNQSLKSGGKQKEQLSYLAQVIERDCQSLREAYDLATQIETELDEIQQEIFAIEPEIEEIHQAIKQMNLERQRILFCHMKACQRVNGFRQLVSNLLEQAEELEKPRSRWFTASGQTQRQFSGYCFAPIERDVDISSLEKPVVALEIAKKELEKREWSRKILALEDQIEEENELAEIYQQQAETHFPMLRSVPEEFQLQHRIVNAKWRWEVQRRRRSASTCKDIVSKYRLELASTQHSIAVLQDKATQVHEVRQRTQLSLSEYMSTENPTMLMYTRVCQALIEQLVSELKECAEAVQAERTSQKQLELALREARLSNNAAQADLRECLANPTEVIDFKLEANFLEYKESEMRCEKLVELLKTRICESVHKCYKRMLKCTPSDVTEGQNGSIRVRLTIKQLPDSSEPVLKLAEEISTLDLAMLLEMGLYNNEIPLIRSKARRAAANSTAYRLDDVQQEFEMCQISVYENENAREMYEHELEIALDQQKYFENLLHTSDPDLLNKIPLTSTVKIKNLYDCLTPLEVLNGWVACRAPEPVRLSSEYNLDYQDQILGQVLAEREREQMLNKNTRVQIKIFNNIVSTVIFFSHVFRNRVLHPHCTDSLFQMLSMHVVFQEMFTLLRKATTTLDQERILRRMINDSTADPVLLITIRLLLSVRELPELAATRMIQMTAYAIENVRNLELISR